MVEVGDRVLSFKLPCATRERIEEFDLDAVLGGGPVVIAFYPLAFTGVCTRQMCDLRDSFEAFRDLDAQVFGFSTDTPSSNRAFAREQELPFGLISDPNRRVVHDLGIVSPFPIVHVEDVPMRAVFVLDATGVLRWKWTSEDPDAWPGVEDVRKAVERARG